MTYRTLQRQFGLDNEALADLKDELFFSHPEITDENDRGLVWAGQGTNGETDGKPDGATKRTGEPAISTPPPASYTPSHLAERIRAVTVTDGERKTITGLFADLKGSTALIEGLDPEEARTVIDPALQLMMDAVHQYDGFECNCPRAS